MFTGLIKTVGRITHIAPNVEGREFTVSAPKIIHELSVGDSVAVDGVCLTATAIAEDSFTVQAVFVTLEKTALGFLHIGSNVNLELAIGATDRFGGHFVQGHVNGIAELEKVVPRGNNYELHFTVPESISRYLIKEGSIALNGISLTIADCNDTHVMVSIIPHTWQATTLQEKKIGDPLNVEIDIIAKYVEKYMKPTTLST